MLQALEHLSPEFGDETYRPDLRGKALVCEHVVQRMGVPIR